MENVKDGRVRATFLGGGPNTVPIFALGSFHPFPSISIRGSILLDLPGLVIEARCSVGDGFGRVEERGVVP